MKKSFTTIAAVCALAAGVSVSQAQPYYLAGAFEGWCNNCTVMTDNGVVGTNGLYGAHQWEYDITGQTASSFDTRGMKVTDGTWNNVWPGNNMSTHYDASGNLSVYYYPGTFTDGFFPTANRVGYSDTGESWEITGSFTTPQWGGGDGSGSDPATQMTLVAGSAGVYTNIYIIATPGTYQWKARTPGTWGSLQIGTDFSGGGNQAFTTVNPNQAVTFMLDLPNGRIGASVPPVFDNVQFSVDMTLVVQSDGGFNPSSVTINGDSVNGWGGTAMTNNPSANNPNVYYSPYFSLQVGTTGQYQFRYLSSGNTMYDALGGIGGQNRTLTVPNLSSTNVPTVYWNDALPTDLLNVDTTVTFSVNMTNAVGTDAHVFDPGADGIFINGDFSGWLAWNPITLAGAGLQCQVVGSSEIYTYTTTFPKGHTRSLTYKYSINGADDEAGYAMNHFRYIRSTNGVCNLPVDVFSQNGAQYAEPKVGGLAIAGKVGGAFPITWLAYPNVHLQRSSSLTGPWIDVDNTEAASSTNWPAGTGNQFFRLLQPHP